MARHRSHFAYWAAVAMAIACIAIVFPGAAALRSRMGITGDSLAWFTGGAVILLILIHELLDSVANAPPKTKPRQPESEIHAVELPGEETRDNRQADNTSEKRDRVTAGTGR